MKQYSKLITLPFIGAAFFLFLLLPIFQVLASENETIGWDETIGGVLA